MDEQGWKSAAFWLAKSFASAKNSFSRLREEMTAIGRRKTPVLTDGLWRPHEGTAEAFDRDGSPSPPPSPASGREGASRASSPPRSLLARLGALAGEIFRARIDKSGGRIRFIAFGLFLIYAGIGGRLILLGLSHEPPQTLKTAADQAVSGARPDLLDRNGEILATDIKTMSVFAEPRRII